MEWIPRFASWLFCVLITLLKPYNWIRDRATSPNIPSAKNPLLNISAVQLAKKIRQREISCEYAVKIYIERIKEVNPLINAVVDERFDLALMDARRYDEMLGSGDVTTIQLEEKMPFFGVPFTVKESCSLKGLSYTGCTLIRKGFKAGEDSVIVHSMIAAGAIPLCVTNTPELCSSFDSTNLLYGITRNPYHGRHSAGGSSGGEAALSGAGASLIGIGSDIAGSIRLPAMFNGVFGHKPTPGIISIEGHYPFSQSNEFRKYLVVGPITRYAEDLHAAVKVMSAGCKQNLRLNEPVDISELKIFYIDDIEHNYGVKSIDYEIKNAILRAATHFKNLGIDVNKATIPDLSESCEIGIISLFNTPELPEILIHPKDPKKKVNASREVLKSIVKKSDYTKSAIFMAFINQINGLIPRRNMPKYFEKLPVLENNILNMLGDNGVLFYPTFPTPAPPIGQVILQSFSAMFCLLFNILGFPSTEIPMGNDRHGLPIGFQVIASPNNDRLCLAVAMELEKAFGGWIPPNNSP